MKKFLIILLVKWQEFYENWIRYDEPFDPKWMDYKRWKESRLKTV